MTIAHQNVLIVGDRSQTWSRIAEVVRSAGYAVTKTDSILEALSMVDDEAFGVCVISPHVLGVEDLLAETQRSQDKSVVIALTDNLQDRMVTRLLDMGLWDCLRLDTPDTLLLLRMERALLERHGQDRRRFSGGTGPVEFTLMGLPSASRYCRSCYTITRDQAIRCEACHADRPESGWPRILESRFPWLGYPMDGRFVIEQVIGRGGAGVVYRAVDNQLRRQLAVKVVVIAEDLSPDRRIQSIQQLKAEALATAKVRSPHVVEIWDVVGLDETTTALIMDYIEGVTLSRYVRDQGALKVPRALAIARQVALALAAAHEHRLVHRDIKPQNVMVETLPDGSPFARVLDFGIVHAIDHLSEGKLSNVGTPMFAAPEQIRSQEIDERTDIYALGGVIHLMLTGEPPYPGKDARTLCRAHLHNEVPDLPASFEASPQVLEMLNGIIHCCLAKEPIRRFANIHNLIAALDEAMERAAIDASVDGTTTQELAPVVPQRKTMDRMLERYLSDQNKK